MRVYGKNQQASKQTTTIKTNENENNQLAGIWQFNQLFQGHDLIKLQRSAGLKPLLAFCIRVISQMPFTLSD